MSARFCDEAIEEHPVVQVYPPFTKITLPDDNDDLFIIEFNIGADDGKSEAAIQVVLDTPITDKLIERLEDSISSYIDTVQVTDWSQMIHDVLNAEGVGHWIVKPSRTIYI